MSAYRLIVLEVESAGLAAELRLNGATVFEENAGGARFLQTKLNPWVVEGANELEVLLGPPPPAGDAEARAPAVAPPKTFSLRCFATEWGVAGPDDALADFRFDEGEHPLPSRGRAVVAALPFSLDAAHGRWAWQDARPFAAGDEGDALAVVLEAHRALDARDAAALEVLMKAKMAELSRALDVPAAELEADQRAYLAPFFSAPDYRVAPLDPRAVRLLPGAGGRLVRVTDAAGGPPLRASGGGRRLALDLTLSRLADGFRIVR